MLECIGAEYVDAIDSSHHLTLRWIPGHGEIAGNAAANGGQIMHMMSKQFDLFLIFGETRVASCE